MNLLPHLLALLLLTGCASSNNSSGNPAGPALGAAAGVTASNALGAPVGMMAMAGVSGASIGYYMTTLRFDAGPIFKAGGDVYKQGEYVGISIPSYKLFETNSAELLPQAEPLLNSAVGVLQRYPNSNILVSGNTSGLNSRSFDQKLSEARARQVAAFLWAHGINNFKRESIKFRKLTFVGYGDYFPIANSSKSSNVQKNSRISITGYPSTADLKLDARSMVFNNIGGLDD